MVCIIVFRSTVLYTVSMETSLDTMMDDTGQCGSFLCSDALTQLMCWRKWKNANRSTPTPSLGSSDSTTIVKPSASVSSPTSHQASLMLNYTASLLCVNNKTCQIIFYLNRNYLSKISYKKIIHMRNLHKRTI